MSPGEEALALSTNRRVVPVLAMAVIVLATLTASSLAADGGPAPAGVTGKNVLGFKLGGYFPDSSDLEDFDAGIHVEGFLERVISRNFRLGAALGYQETSNSSTSFQLDQDVSSTYLLVNAKLMVPVQAFEPYAEAGGGFYLTHIKESLPVGSLSEQDSSFGYFAGGGVNWYFTKDYFIGVGGRYFWSETKDLNIALDGLLVDVNLGVRF
jgi:opacity protein-like surface antigen